MATTPDTTAGHWAARYYVPWSQVHPNSTGAQTGRVHLDWHGDDPVTLTAISGRRTTITRNRRDALCGHRRTRRSPWYDREPNLETWDDRCPRCVTAAERYGVDWSTAVGADLMLSSTVTP